MEHKLIAEYQVEYRAIAAGKFRRYGRGVVREVADVRTQLQNAADVPKVIKGYVSARSILKNFQPDVVFAKGSQVGLAVGLAAGHLHIPLVIHEPDIEMGRGNRSLSKLAQVITTGFPTQYYKLPRTVPSAKLVFVGNPVRSEVIIHKQTKTEHSIPTMLVMGGSQGASAINSFVFENLSRLLEGYNINHIVGKGEIELGRVHRSRLNGQQQTKYQVFDFADAAKLKQLYMLADIAITRPGMNSIVELAANGIPPIVIVPATNHHQLLNAQTLVKMGAARMFMQNNLELIPVRATIDRLLERNDERQHLLEQLKKLYNPQAAKELALVIMEAAKPNIQTKGPHG